jgi:hypothetical protein
LRMVQFAEIGQSLHGVDYRGDNCSDVGGG